MDSLTHTMPNLFDQLGLASDETSIRQFLITHSPLPHGLPLAEAPFWTLSQKAFLRDEILNDADWAEVIDTLNAALHLEAD
ncbi:MAG TPA: DUF2789 domain-containing protein [Methyloradius sp.]